MSKLHRHFQSYASICKTHLLDADCNLVAGPSAGPFPRGGAYRLDITTSATLRLGSRSGEGSGKVDSALFRIGI